VVFLALLLAIRSLRGVIVSTAVVSQKFHLGEDKIRDCADVSRNLYHTKAMQSERLTTTALDRCGAPALAEEPHVLQRLQLDRLSAYTVYQSMCNTLTVNRFLETFLAWKS
jgi:hypothetical protein